MCAAREKNMDTVFLVARASSAAEGEAAKGKKDYGWVIGFAIALWVVFFLTLPLAYLLFWWRPLYYEGFTTERAIRTAFDFFVALTITLALMLALTIAAATVAIKNDLKKLARAPVSCTSGEA